MTLAGHHTLACTLRHINTVRTQHRTNIIQASVALYPRTPQCHYQHMPIGKVWICRLLFVCLFFVYVRLRISLPMIKLAASNFARWFIGVLGRESHILENFASPEAPPEAQNRKNRIVGSLATTRRTIRKSDQRGPCAFRFVQRAGHA